jgi:hypothetical protein
MHKTAGLAEWYKEHGRHPVYAKGNNVPLKTTKHSLSLPIVNAILAENGEQPAQSVSPYLIEENEEATIS